MRTLLDLEKWKKKKAEKRKIDQAIKEKADSWKIGPVTFKSRGGGKIQDED